ncbi:MAG: hypothetical protein LKG20_04740 [Tetrasphaera jenkinsii]|jgi:hypothetical protein|uniref:Uncharacterized protein n=1 Tax=Nostocoides jenkinsii Ben 74 TaxID=1193518 RepID=A0A077MA96_9MICO|nr:hypothetical protein [Tetrasphaera jenkinsii]MCI1261578.1 hypothetical protein [Tetrasphaera jenkinsii]CCI53544.1 hypothetical protein BN13_410020 [Tetrasphaera jenkinsii Ben 74]
MSTNDELYGEGDRQLIAILAALVQDEESTPQAVLEAASAIHDWVDVDARLAELTADPVLTRGDESALAFAVGSIRLRVEIEPAGYRRRRLVLVAHDEDTVEAAEVISAQFPNGQVIPVAPDRFGERITQVPAGTVRMIAVFPSGVVCSPWFTV